MIKTSPVAFLIVAVVMSMSIVGLVAQSQQAPPQQQPQASSVKGELTAVDVEKMILTVKPAQGDALQIQYNEKTQVTGRGGVAGLRTSTGRQVVVQFRMEGANRVATRIDIQEKP